MPYVARLRSAARSARLAIGVLACLTLLVLVGLLANSSTAFAMSEKEFKEKCIAQGGVYSGPANDELGAWGSQGAGTCSWTTCWTEYKPSRKWWGPTPYRRAYEVCDYRELRNVSRT